MYQTLLDPIKFLRWFWTGSPLVSWFFFLLLLPFLFAGFEMNIKTCRTILSPANIAYQSFGSDCLTRRCPSDLLRSRICHGRFPLFRWLLRIIPLCLSRFTFCLFFIASLLMSHKTFWKERPSAIIARDKCFLIECVKSLVVIFLQVIFSTADSFYHLIIILWFFRDRSPYICRFVGFNFFPLFDTLRDMYINRGSSVLLSADITNHCFWSFCFVP